MYESDILRINEERIKRFKEIKSQIIDESVLKYINNLYENLHINIGGDYEGNILELMIKGALNGWCFETTETASVFLPNDSRIIRGNLEFAKDYLYYHSWLTFYYNNAEYVFDPSLIIISKKEIYDEIFKVEKKAIIGVLSVKNELIRLIEKYKKANNLENIDFNEETHLKGVSVVGNNDVTSPMYRNNAKYLAVIEDGCVKKLKAHFFYRG